MKAADIGCIVLASGLSNRFGPRDKLSADLCGKSVLDHVLETVISVGFGDVFLVTQERTRDGFKQVINDAPESGQGHALRLGLAAAKAAGWKTVCIVLGDMPLVQVTHLQGLIAELGEAHSAVSIFDDQIMPPAIFRGSAITSILADNSSLGARRIFHLLNPVFVPITAEQALDVDTPSDLARVEYIMKVRNT